MHESLVDKRLSETHLVVFMTKEVSLELWDRAGMLDREIAIYNAVRPFMRKLTLVTFGGKNDLKYQDRLPGVDIVTNRWNLPFTAYLLYIARALPLFWGRSVIVKSNQMRGAELVVKAARVAGGKSIVRCGYMYGLHTARVYGEHSPETQSSIDFEREQFLAADQCNVTAEDMRDQVIAYGVPTEKVDVVPNYVVEDYCSPPAEIKDKVVKICSVGRFEKQKNILNMLTALEGLDVELQLVGDGSLKKKAKKLVNDLGLHVEFRGNVGHRELLDVFKDSDLYLQPSRYEGHPKTILEAMACGLPVVAGNSPGISNFMRHGDTGWLCGLESEEIREAVLTVMSDLALRSDLALNARKYALQQVGLSHVMQRELDVYRKILARTK